MASFVIHHIVGENFLTLLDKKLEITLTPIEQKQFLLGNLVVDSTRISKEIPDNLDPLEKQQLKRKIALAIQEEKIKTHFRDPNTVDQTIQAPIPDRFIHKYYDLFDHNPAVLGYLVHLYTDKYFFDDLFRATFEMVNRNNNQVIYDRDVDHIHIYKTGENQSPKKFWSDQGMYRDYTIMNRYLLDCFHTKFDEQDLMKATTYFHNPGIEEVDFENIDQVLHETASYIQESNQMKDAELRIFDEEKIQSFVPTVLSQFVELYPDLIEKTLIR